MNELMKANLLSYSRLTQTKQFIVIDDNTKFIKVTLEGCPYTVSDLKSQISNFIRATIRDYPQVERHQYLVMLKRTRSIDDHFNLLRLLR